MARQAFVAVGGTLPESHGTDAAPSCDDYWAGAAVAMWFAAQAELTAGPEYVAYYTGLSDGFAAAGAACDAA